MYDSQDLQLNLDKIYVSYMEHILNNDLIKEALISRKISHPQFLDINVDRGKYESSSFKILFVGQETNGWGGGRGEITVKQGSWSKKDIEEYINLLKKEYFKFNIGATYYNTPFYQFINEIIKRKKNVGFLMANCLRHDGLNLGSKRIPTNMEEIITFENNFVFMEELKILNPDCVIFLTGPNYDDVLKKTFNQIEFIEHNNYKVREFSILKHEKLPAKSFRIYHPNYLNRKGKNYKQVILNKIESLI